jgi:hypothetical protein
MASERDTTIDKDTFEAAMRVQQSAIGGPVVVPGPVMQSPPICPSAGCLANAAEVIYLLYVVRPNEKGDVLLACLNCGYEAVYRLATNRFEARPGRTEKWTPPYRAPRDVVQRMSQGEPAKFSVPKAVQGAKPEQSTAVEKPARRVANKKKGERVVEEPRPLEEVTAGPITPPDAVQVEAKRVEIKAYSVKEAAAIAGVHFNKVSHAIRRGELVAQDIAGIKIVLSHDLEAWMGSGVKTGG